jgi:dihydroneopterin aldolase
MSSQFQSPQPAHRVEQAVGGSHYRIFVRDLVLLCSIGAYPEERHRRQRVRFNIDMQVRAADRPLDDDLANVLSYDTVIADIRHLVDRGHINLVETLAEQVAECCLADPRVTDVRVIVEKLDMEPAAAGVGIEIERRRQSYPAAADLLRWGAESRAEGAQRRRHAGF